MICCQGGIEKPRQTLPDQRALGWPQRHTHVDGEQFESVFYKVALKATGQWLLSEVSHSCFSLVKAHRGSQLAILAGQISPREGGQDLTWFVLHMF